MNKYIVLNIKHRTITMINFLFKIITYDTILILSNFKSSNRYRNRN